jgi:hypothetical protein
VKLLSGAMEIFQALRASQNSLAVGKFCFLQIRIFPRRAGGIIMTAHKNALTADYRTLAANFTLTHNNKI